MSVDEILLKSRFQPLERILAYDVFNTGFNGWMTLMPNFTEYPDFDVPATLQRPVAAGNAQLSDISLSRNSRGNVRNIQSETLDPSGGRPICGKTCRRLTWPRHQETLVLQAGKQVPPDRVLVLLYGRTVVTAHSLDSMRTPSEISEWDSTYRNTGNAIS